MKTKNTPSQSERIINWLKVRRGKNGRRLTALDALKRFNCWNLKGRIWDLRKKFNIQKEWKKTRSGKIVASYYLKKAACLLLVLFLSSSCSNPVLKYNKTHKASFR
jgi:hypothetical protein